MCMQFIGNVINLSMQKQLQSFCPFLPRCLYIAVIFPFDFTQRGKPQLPQDWEFISSEWSTLESKCLWSQLIHYHIQSQKKAPTLFHTTKRKDNFGCIHCIPNTKKSGTTVKNILHTCLWIQLTENKGN